MIEAVVTVAGLALIAYLTFWLVIVINAAYREAEDRARTPKPAPPTAWSWLITNHELRIAAVPFDEFLVHRVIERDCPPELYRHPGARTETTREEGGLRIRVYVPQQQDRSGE